MQKIGTSYEYYVLEHIRKVSKKAIKKASKKLII